MYEKYFGLTERPFSIAPDPRFLYMSQQHREALAHLIYGVGEGGGFIQLTGEVGTGKTTICRCLLEQLPQHVDVALILNPRVTALELLATLCDELRIPYAKDTTSIKSLIDVLNAHLLATHARGRRTVLIIDEAQNLSAEVLEQVRLLTNLETTREKLLQIVLIGQPELRELLARNELRQLSQRITARYHLDPIQRPETAAYIRHRLQVCGSVENIFTERAIDLIQKLSTGVPRLINVLCDRAMLGAFVEGRRTVDVPVVRNAAREVLPEEGHDAPRHSGLRWLIFTTAAVATAAAVMLLALVVEYFAPSQWWSVLGDKWSTAGQSSVEMSQPAADTQMAQVTRWPDTVAAGATQNVAVVQDDLTALERTLVAAGPAAAASAWIGLYRLWGVQSSVTSAEEACNEAISVSLQCLEGVASWDALSRFDRPAILLLVDSVGRRVPVLLEGVQGRRARVVVDGSTLEIPLDQLELHWNGEFHLLWKSPPQGSSALHPGDRSGDVQWLREQLKIATGMTAIAPDPHYFDAGLKELVQSFQRGRELEVDGVAGARTLIRLNNLTTQQGIPRLGVRAMDQPG